MNPKNEKNKHEADLDERALVSDADFSCYACMLMFGFRCSSISKHA
jgi:hypothetical protein